MPRSAALRRAGPPAVVGLALLLGAITVGYAWVVARHLSDEARRASRAFGLVFAGLNDPRADAATDALLELAGQGIESLIEAQQELLRLDFSGGSH